jgi:predicted ester cyclase
MSEVTLTEVREAVEVDVTRPVVEFVAAINRGDLDAAIAQLTPDHLHHGRVSNYRPEGVRVLFTLLRSVMPDLRLDIREMTVDGTRVVTRIVGTGVHTGSYLGKEPTGRPVAWQSVDIAEITPGLRENDWRISERFWDLFNDPSLWQEIGFIPAIMC